MPLTLASPTRVPSASLERPPRDAGATSKRPWGGPPVAPEGPATHPGATPVSRRGGRPGAPGPAPRVRGGTPQGRDGGDRTLEELREVIRELDRDAPLCPRCRRRPRQYKGMNRWSWRKYRMLCARCQRDLRVAAGYQDLPAPICRECWERPRALKGYRHGRPRWRRTCWRCDRAARVARGLPADRGRRGTQAAPIEAPGPSRADRRSTPSIRRYPRRARLPWSTPAVVHRCRPQAWPPTRRGRPSVPASFIFRMHSRMPPRGRHPDNPWRRVRRSLPRGRSRATTPATS